MSVIEIKLREDLPDNCKLVDVEDEQGIKALKDGEDVISYQFEKSKWTQEAANKWVKIKTEIRQPVTKSFDFTYKNFDDKTLSFDAIGSTEGSDRDGDILRAKGWKFDRFVKNPRLLWSHDAKMLSIGNVTNPRINENGEMTFRPVFTPKDLNPFGEQVYRMYKAGFMNAFSVRFDPFEWKERERPSDAKAGDRFGIEYTKQELLEISAVNIPANADALMSRDFQDFIVKSMQMKNLDLVNDPIIKEQILKGVVEEVKPEPVVEVKTEEAKKVEDATEDNEKAGRVLSAKNRGIISTAITALNELLDATQEEPKEIDSDAELKALQDDLDNLKKDDDVERLLHDAEGVFDSISD